MAAPHPVLAAPSRRQRLAVLVVLLALAAAGWGLFLVQASGGSMDMDVDVDGAGDGPDMDMDMDMDRGEDGAAMDMAAATTADPAPGGVPDLSMGRDALPFVGSWTAMMAAMMLPAAAPMVLLYARTQPGRPLNVGLFTGSYLGLWVAFGVGAFALAVVVEDLVGRYAAVADNWARLAGALIVLAGLYQFSPLKERCLRACRSPLGFIFSAWRPGASGALRMGLHHGLYCAGCCWLLFVVLVPIGVMSVAAMLLVAAAVLGEKLLPRPRVARNLTAAVLITYGAAVVAQPALLPTVA